MDEAKRKALAARRGAHAAPSQPQIVDTLGGRMRVRWDQAAACGVSQVSALTLLSELMVLPSHLKACQLSRYAGLDVRQAQSGSSINRPGRLSKAGNAYLRSALFMPALAAVRHDVHARAFFEALVVRGKKRIQAVCAVMRKYLTGIWACLRANESFDSAKLFSTAHLGA